MSEGPSTLTDRSDFKPEAGTTALSDSDRQLLDKLLSATSWFPKRFKLWLREQWMIDPPDIPISQVFGFPLTTPVSNEVQTSEGTASNSFADLATVGPQLTGLPSGTFLFFFGCTSWNSSGGGDAVMGLKINSTEASDTESTHSSVNVTPGPSVSRVLQKTLTVADNTVTARYHRSGGVGTATFEQRWLIAMRVANL